MDDGWTLPGVAEYCEMLPACARVYGESIKDHDGLATFGATFDIDRNLKWLRAILQVFRALRAPLIGSAHVSYGDEYNIKLKRKEYFEENMFKFIPASPNPMQNTLLMCCCVSDSAPHNLLSIKKNIQPPKKSNLKFQRPKYFFDLLRHLPLNHQEVDSTCCTSASPLG